ncbi:hypothetical protein J6590_013439 [Homalodisca vitripennis]|nr:hypothetical protein J6590_013439 [Homalodisca vitripennis]
MEEQSRPLTTVCLETFYSSFSVRQSTINFKDTSRPGISDCLLSEALATLTAVANLIICPLNIWRAQGASFILAFSSVNDGSVLLSFIPSLPLLSRSGEMPISSFLFSFDDPIISVQTPLLELGFGEEHIRLSTALVPCTN